MAEPIPLHPLYLLYLPWKASGTHLLLGGQREFSVAKILPLTRHDSATFRTVSGRSNHHIKGKIRLSNILPLSPDQHSFTPQFLWAPEAYPARSAESVVKEAVREHDAREAKHRLCWRKALKKHDNCQKCQSMLTGWRFKTHTHTQTQTQT